MSAHRALTVNRGAHRAPRVVYWPRRQVYYGLSILATVFCTVLLATVVLA